MATLLSIWSFFSDFFSDRYMPHGDCYLWEPDVLFLNIIGDAMIVMAYYSIPVALIYFVRKRTDLVFTWIFVLFGAFIFACGTTHLMDVITVWHPYYKLEGIIKMLTAGVSVATAVLLFPLIPRALALPSPEMLRVKNEKLQEEIAFRKKAEQKLEKKTEDLRRSNEALEHFAYIASHDLQEPLRMISSYVTLLKKRYQDKLDDSGNEFIDYASDGAKRLQQMIQDLLQYSRLSRSDEKPEPVDLNRVMESVLRNLQMKITEKDAEVTFTALPVVKGSSAMLSQLFQNLIENGIKFSQEGLKPVVNVGYEEKNDYFEFWVKDNGIGFEQKYAEQIFDIFQRLHSREEYKGTGIGLAVCKKIVENHGGNIWVESSPGEGSTFRFTIAKVQTHDSE